MRSVYIHIPFCNSICSYCDFCKMLYNTSWVNAYLNQLEKEINEKYDQDEVKSIYIGGGTPSSLNILELKRLLEIIKIFNKSDKCEYSFEMNVDDINREKLTLLKKYGINRISIGIESFNDNNLKFLNRKHTKEEIKQKINLVKSIGFTNINVDLMYALPSENYQVFKKDLKDIIKLNVNHISTYSLIIEPNTALYVKNVKPINEDEDYKMYSKLCKTLRKKGYKHYEVSNFAKKGYESIHNTNYWNNGEYYGFGLGSHGYISDMRYENTRSFNKYLKGEYRLNELVVSKQEEMENEVILGLRKLEGINVKHFFNKYKSNIQDIFNIRDCIKKGYLILENEFIRIPEDKIYVMNEILTTLLESGENVHE